MINDVNNLLLREEGCRYKGKTPTILCMYVCKDTYASRTRIIAPCEYTPRTSSVRLIAIKLH